MLSGSIYWNVTLFWLLVFVFNKLLIDNRFTSATYAKILSKNGLTVKLMHIKWYTVKCNRLFIKLSSWKSNFLKHWFNIGVIIGLVGQFLSFFLLLYTIYDFFRPKPLSKQIIVPVLPGVNVPSSQVWYYLAALFLCGLVHELGHAIAASREQVRVNGFGVFLVAIFPGAYVDLCTDHIMVISPLRQLRIFCAGVWHNFVFVLLALALLKAHPYAIKHLFDKKAHIVSISAESPLESSVKINSIINQVAHCNVSDSFSYFQCLHKYESEPIPGHCLSLNQLYKLSSFTVHTDKVLEDCCNVNFSSTHFCFNWKLDKNAYSCLPARPVTEKKTCLQNSDCDQEICVMPLSSNNTKLIRIDLEEEPAVLFVGSVRELLYTVFIEDNLAKYTYVPKFLNQKLKLLLKYIIAFSGAIGILNLVPCFALDGQYILASLLSLNKKSEDFPSIPQKRPLVYVILMILGSSLLVINIFLAFVSMAYSKFLKT